MGVVDKFSDYSARDCLVFIKENDRNGFETLDGDETVEQLREACRLISACD